MPAATATKPVLKGIWRAIREARVPKPPATRTAAEAGLDNELISDALKATENLDTGTPTSAPNAPDPAPVSPTEGVEGVEAVSTPMQSAMADVEQKAQGIDIAEAEGLTNRALAEYDLDENIQLNFNRIEGEEDVQAMIAELATRNAGRISDERRGVMSDALIASMADDLGVRASALRQVMTRQEGDLLSAEHVLASRQMLNASAMEVHRLATMIQSGTATDLDKLAFRRQLAFHNAFQAQFMGARAEIGRALRAFRPAVMMDPNRAADMAEVTQVALGRHTETYARNIAAAVDATGRPDVKEINRATRGPLWKRLERATVEMFTANILSGFKTLMVNATGSPIMLGMEAVETAVASRIGAMERYLLNHDDGVQIGEATAMLQGMFSSVGDGYRVAKQAFITGEAPDGFVKFDLDYQPAISSENFDVAGPVAWATRFLGERASEAAGRGAARALDITGSASRIMIERGMVPTDEFFKAVAYRASLSRSAYRQVWREVAAKEIPAEEASARMIELMENADFNPMMDEAQAFARHIAFQTPLGPTGRAWQNAFNGTPMFSVVAPFIKTPTNIFKEGVSRTPLGALQMFSPEFRKQFVEDAAFRHQWLGRQSLAGLTAGGVAWMTLNDHISGAGPSNWEAQKLMRSTGWRPYSVRVPSLTGGPDEWVSYMRGEPFSFAVGITATLVEGQMALDYEDPLATADQQYWDAANLVVSSLSASFLDKTFMTGPQDFFEAMSDPQRRFKLWAESMGTAFIPFSSMQRQTRQLTDPYLREAQTLSEKMTNMRPGYSDDLPYKLDAFGDPILYDRGVLLQQWSVFPSSPVIADPVKLELGEIAKRTNAAPITMPSRTIDGIRLTGPQYFDYVLASRQEVEIGGMRFVEFLGKHMDSSFYQNATVEGRVDQLRSIQRQFDEKARDIMRSRNIELRDAARARRELRRDLGIFR